MFSIVKRVFKSYCFPHKHVNFISLQAFGVISVLDFGHSSRYRVILIEFAWTYDVGHVFICLFAVSISSLMRCPLRSLVHFNWVVFYCWILRVHYSFLIKNESSAKIFSQCVASLLILLTFTSQHMFLILMKFNLSIISFVECIIGIYLKTCHHTQGHLGFLLYYFLEVL